MARHKVRLHPFFPQHFCSGDRNCENGWLCVDRLLKLICRTLEAKFRERKTQGRVRFLKNRARGRELLKKLPAHSGMLRTLAGKHEGDLQEIGPLALRFIKSINR